MPIEALRPHFWQVAADRADTTWKTPFEKHRTLDGLDQPEMAGRMGWDIDQYRAFEQGTVRATATDVLRFCDLLALHPLDLYPEPGADVPLPAEMRDALRDMVRDPTRDSFARERALERLRAEHDRAESILKACVDEINPLLVALGFASDRRDYHAPLYRRRAAGEGAPSRLETMIEGGRHNTRGLINAYITASVVAQEDFLDLQTQVLQPLVSKRDMYGDVVSRVAAFIYGKDGAETAIERLRAHLSDNDDVRGMRDRLVSNPSMLWTPAVGVRHKVLDLPYVAEWRGLGFYECLGLMVGATKMHMIFAAAAERQMKTVNAVLKSVDDTHKWLRHPRTQRLLDWFENWLEVDASLDGDDAPDADLIAARLPRLAMAG